MSLRSRTRSPYARRPKAPPPIDYDAINRAKAAAIAEEQRVRQQAIEGATAGAISADPIAQLVERAAAQDRRIEALERRIRALELEPRR
ncbi:MAG TPA: hypothetical protein VMA83_01715 [Solirubrobacteraceae bacterium]|nr:hypothetical protein [Solirubrobacteraceae bacterium]